MSYITSQKQQLLDSIENQVLYANIGCVLVGREGIGKSFTLEQIRSRVRSEVFISEIVAEAVMTQAQIEKTICLQLGLGWQDDNKSIAQKISENSERRTLLTIDNAHLLSPACLEFVVSLISEQAASQTPSLFIILAGNISLAKHLNETPSLRANPNLCALFELTTFEKNETLSLVADFQKTDESTIEAIYDKQKLEYFWQLSEGVPGKLEYQIERWLDKDEGKVGNQKTSKFGYLSAVGYGVVAVILIVALLFQDQINDAISPSKPTLLTKAQVDQTKSKVKASDNINLKQKPNQDVNASNTEAVKNAKNVESKLSNPSSQELQKKQSSKLQEQIKSDDDSLSSHKKSEDKNIGSGSSVIEEQKDEIEKNEIEKNQQSEKIVELSEKKSKAKASIEFTEDEKYLLSLNKEIFTLQWVGVSEFKSAQVFKEKHPLSSQMRIFQRRSGDKVLYLVVSGSFNSKLDASNAKLIYQQRNYPGSPWIKSLAAIQKEIQPSQSL